MVSCLKYVLYMHVPGATNSCDVIIPFYVTMTMYYGPPADMATLSLGDPDQENEGVDLMTTVQLTLSGGGILECDITVTLDTNDVTASRTHRSPHALSTPSHVVFPFPVHRCSK